MNDEISDCITLPPGHLLNHRGQRFEILKQIWSGPFSEVMVVKDITGGERYAMKTEKTSDPKRSVLKLDVFVLREFENTKIKGFPQFIAQGRIGRLKYVVMQLLGPDLGKLRRSLPGKKFSLTTALRLGIQTMNRIEALHDAGWISRDIKANNFAVGPKNDIQTPRSSAALIGSIHYSSLAAHAFRDQCRRDDIESWFYMVCELIKGPLPWASADARKDYILIGEWKRYARYGGRYELLKGMPEEFDKILDLIDNTKYYERPDYRTFYQLVNNIFTRLKLNRKTPFEWQDNPQLIRKASVIGDEGESCFASFRLRELTNKPDNDDDLVIPPCNPDLACPPFK
ncbi:unnamed protein product [Gongylonema pulchrum]|uniref:Protein kinase domain-containing protein n=1 Tax=Gongylonema pulchrum TaxID=637853 RepID=A0A183CXP7_9BILA|nr:unnamed protein product [Gongylonema pulchrum]